MMKNETIPDGKSLGVLAVNSETILELFGDRPRNQRQMPWLRVMTQITMKPMYQRVGHPKQECDGVTPKALTTKMEP
jgi:hypothetical protein